LQGLSDKDDKSFELLEDLDQGLSARAFEIIARRIKS
jgi:hypothetical protein